MHASNPARNLILVEEVLTQLALDTHGALSTLSSSCFEQFGGVAVSQARVAQWAEVWRSYVIVTRQMVRSNDSRQAAWEILDRVLKIIDSLKVAFTRLITISDSSPAAACELREMFAASYDKLEADLDEIGKTLRLQLSFPDQFSPLRRESYKRSVKWLDGELARLAARKIVAAI